MATVSTIQSATIRVANPATGETLAELPAASAGDIQVAIHRARAAQPAWAAIGPKSRARVLREFLKILNRQRDEVAALITSEAGKPQVEALLTEMIPALDAAQFCAAHAASFLQPERIRHANPIMKTKKGYLLREPHGVVGIISPWNYPFSIPTTEVLAAIAMGNSVVLKPSELTPLCALRLQTLLRQAGVPEAVVEVVIGDGSAGAALLSCEDPVDKIVFTGSVRTGTQVAQAAAAKLIPVVLELGGKDPMIVLEDADVEVAASAAVWGAFVNAGQTCLSVERCYVHRKLLPQFLAACTEKTSKLRVGDGSRTDIEVGPMIHERQLAAVEKQVQDAVARGAKVLVGGKRLSEMGPNFYAPTVITNVDHSMALMREETFGPVLPIMGFDSEDEAVQLANDSEFGLAASLWTRDRVRGEALARRIQAGTVMVNDCITGFAICEAPHGGIKSSGIGRTHGRMGLEEMVRVKYVDSDLLPRMSKIWWYGYSQAFSEQMRGFVDFLFAGRWDRRLKGGFKSAAALRRKKI
jgi:succinate-semialdehyde dehydrogenase/glutarate-semialdehyde dehydrogenase